MSEYNSASPSLAGTPREEQIRALIQQMRKYQDAPTGVIPADFARIWADELSLLAAVPSSADLTGKSIQPLPWVATHQGEYGGRIVDANGMTVTNQVTADEADFIVMAVNRYAK